MIQISALALIILVTGVSAAILNGDRVCGALLCDNKKIPGLPEVQSPGVVNVQPAVHSVCPYAS